MSGNDIKSLKLQIKDVNRSIEEAAQLNKHLRSEAEKKILELTKLDHSIAQEIESLENKRKLIDVNDEASFQSYYQMHNELLKIKTNGLQSLIPFETIQHENVNLKFTHEEMCNQMLKLRQGIASTESELRQNAFSTKLTLDKIMRDTITEYVIESKSKLIKSLRSDAAASVDYISKTKSEYKQREVMCTKLVEKQKKSFDRQNHLKIENSLMQSTIDIQTERMESYSKNIKKYEDQKECLEEDIEALTEDVEELKAHAEERNELEKLTLQSKNEYMKKNKELNDKKECVMKAASAFLKKCFRVANGASLDDLDIAKSITNPNSRYRINSMELGLSMGFSNNVHHNKSMLIRKRGGKLKSLEFDPAVALRTTSGGEIDYTDIWQSR